MMGAIRLLPREWTMALGNIYLMEAPTSLALPFLNNHRIKSQASPRVYNLEKLYPFVCCTLL